MRLRFFPSTVLLAVLGACAEDGIVLTITSRSNLSAFDEIRASAWAEGLVDPLDTGSKAATRLPQAFLTTVGPQGRSARYIRIHVDVLLGGNPVASGDRIIDATKSDERTLEVDVNCRGLICPGIQLCDTAGDRAVCGRACTEGAGCVNYLIGCGSVTCEGAGDLENTGTCAAVSALDEDQDSLLDPTCALVDEPEEADCDDTDPNIGLGGDAPLCGSARDHDCDSLRKIDEFEGCSSSCAMDSDPSATSELFSTESTVLRVGVVRNVIDRESGAPLRMALVATEEQILSVAIPPGDDPVRIDSVPMSAGTIRDVAVAGRIAAVASSQGLILISIDSFGELTQLGSPIEVPPGNAGSSEGLLTVLANEETVWVSGPGVGLGAVDISIPSSPMYLGRVGNLPAIALALTDIGMLMATTTPDENNRRVFLCQAGPLARPANCRAVDWDALTGDSPIQELPDSETILALAARPDAADDEIVAVASSVGERSFVRLFSIDGLNFTPTDLFELTGRVISLTIDDGTILAGTTSGTVHLLLRNRFDAKVMRDEADEPIVETVAAQDEACAAATCTEGLWASTTPDGLPFAAVGIANSLKVISFDCAP